MADNPANPSWAEAARQTNSAMESHFRAKKDLYYETYGLPTEVKAWSLKMVNGVRPYAFVWPLSQTVDAILAASQVEATPPLVEPEAATTAIGSLERYWDPDAKPGAYISVIRHPRRPGSDMYYDDNHWIGLNLVQGYRLTGDEQMLKRSQEVFDLLLCGWDPIPSHPMPGGVYWTEKKGNHDRGTVSTAGAAQLGLQLYLLTRDPNYLDWSRQMLDWVNQYMRAPNDLYWDHVELDGKVEKTQWSYNQGLMLGASTLLYVATGETDALRDAERIAHAALDHFNTPERFFKQPPYFNAIFFRNLLMLDAVAPNPRYREAAEAYAADLLRQKIDPTTWLHTHKGTLSLNRQAGVVQTFSYLAMKPEVLAKALGVDQLPVKTASQTQIA